jgi:DNA-binding beta-propeller fold protein YncE
LSPPIVTNKKWKQHGVTVAGGNKQGIQLNQLSHPHGIYVDDDNQSIYIADYSNHRIVKWKSDAKIGEIVAGGRKAGNGTDQLEEPTDVLVDRRTDSLIICDYGNRRVMQWSRRNGRNGQQIISDISCFGLAIDYNGDLYVSDEMNHEVKRWGRGETSGTIVAGGHEKGNQLNQLNGPTYLFVDTDQSVYVSDRYNHRVMKWMKGAEEGIIVAGGHGEGNSLNQLSYPYGVTVDHSGNVYVADYRNYRIMCWSKGSNQGRVIVGGNGKGQQSNQLSNPYGLSCNRQDQLYVADSGNDRVQKFETV